MNDETEVLLDVAVLGEQVDQFFKSDIGQYLQLHIAREISESLWKLRQVDCNDPSAVFKAQMEAWRAESIRNWLEEAITAGLKARMILEDREE